MDVRKVCLSLLLIGTSAFFTIKALTIERFSWDLSIAEWVQNLGHGGILGPIATYNNRMGVIGVAGVIGVTLVGWLWFKGRRAEAALVGLVGVADLLNPLLRELIGRPRPSPDLIFVYRPQTDFSFPSGTAMHVLMFSGIIIYLSLHLVKHRGIRISIVALMSCYIPLMGMWLVYRGCHWPSDVIGGYLYGGFFLWAIIWIYRRYVAWRRAYAKEYIPKERLLFLAQPLRRLLVMVR